MKKGIMITILLFIVLFLCIGAASRYVPATDAIYIPLPSGTPLLINLGKVLVSNEAVVGVTINTAMTTAAGWYVWLDQATPEVTPDADNTLLLQVSGAVGLEKIYESSSFANGLAAARYTCLTKNATSSDVYLMVKQSGNQDNGSTLIVDTMR